ncbi:histone H1-gamma, late-like [Lineus longissimus]|uniref:histone H1-gamma, late-like n=1 Tax=Lineus longissimus TaxID=88925 RepID=UPI002B4F0A3C
MAGTKISAAPAAAVRTSKPRPPAKVMAKAAVAALKERTGSSRPAIMKYIAANYNYDNAKAVATALKKGVEAGTFIQVKASFKLSAEAKLAPKPKKPAAKLEKANKTKTVITTAVKTPKKSAKKALFQTPKNDLKAKSAARKSVKKITKAAKTQTPKVKKATKTEKLKLKKATKTEKLKLKKATKTPKKATKA